MLLDQPEVVGAVRSELAPAGLKLLDVYYMASWGSKAKIWKGLGLAAHAKYATLFCWVSGLAPDAGLPLMDDLTAAEINAWGIAVERAAEKFFEQFNRAKSKMNSRALCSGELRAGWVTSFNLYTLMGNAVLNFTGAHAKLAPKAGRSAVSPLPEVLPKKSIDAALLSTMTDHAAGAQAGGNHRGVFGL